MHETWNTDLIPRSGRSPGGGHGNPLQHSCLESLMDRRAWWVTVHGIAKSQIRLKQLSTTHKYIPSFGGSFPPPIPTPLSQRQLRLYFLVAMYTYLFLVFFSWDWNHFSVFGRVDCVLDLGGHTITWDNSLIKTSRCTIFLLTVCSPDSYLIHVK